MSTVVDLGAEAAPLPSAAPLAQPAPWRQRLQPLVDGRGGWLVTGLVALVAGLLRFTRLDLPGSKIFDEIYYSCDALNLLRFGVEHDTVPNNPDCIPRGGGAFIAHPPFGKWLIAVGIKLFGNDSFGWRFSAAVAGTLTVVILVRVARRMTGSTLLGAVAGLLLSLDGLHFVQSRASMLDIFLTLWTTAAFACLVLDRDDVRRRLAAAPEVHDEGPGVGGRPWLWLAGICLGAGLGTKWSAVYNLVGLLLLAFAWEVGARRTAGVRAPVRAVLARSALPLLGGLVVVPVVVYTLTWTGWFLSDIGYDRHWAATAGPSAWSWLPAGLRSWLHYHQEIFNFHTHLQARHPYQSHPLGWLVLARPVSYYYPGMISMGQYGCAVASCSREVLAIGNPAIWWAGIPMLLAMLWLWLAKRDWRAAAVLVLVAVAILPWIPDDLRHRTMFLFYALPAVPFLCLGLALVAGWVLGGPGATATRRTVGAAVVGGYLTLVVLLFAYFYPILAAVTIPYSDWRGHMWFSSWI